MHYFTTYESDIVGPLTIIAADDGLFGVFMDKTRHQDKYIPKDMEEDAGHPHVACAIEWFDRYFAGEKPTAAELKLAPSGTDFRKLVWKALAEIPYGQTTTYGEIAKRIASENGRAKASARAVGGAVGHNPINIIVPCHRVIGANNSLTGYGGGIKRKVALLAFEGVDMGKLTIPTRGTAI